MQQHPVIATLHNVNEEVRQLLSRHELSSDELNQIADYGDYLQNIALAEIAYQQQTSKKLHRLVKSQSDFGREK